MGENGNNIGLVCVCVCAFETVGLEQKEMVHTAVLCVCVCVGGLLSLL